MINDHYGTQMSNRVGAVRYLSYNANIKDTRGFLDTDNADNGSTDINSIAEMLTPFVTNYDDLFMSHSM